MSIDITTEQHQQLKAIAALNGQSIKEFVPSRTFRDTPGAADSADMDEAAAVLRFSRYFLCHAPGSDRKT